MAIAFVKQIGEVTWGFGDPAAKSASFGSLPSAGNLIVVVIGGGTGQPVVSVADNQSNTYTKAKAQANGSNNVEIWYSAGIGSPSGTFTVTVTLTASGFPLAGFDAAEFSGVATSSPVDVTSSNTGSSASPDSGSITTLNASDLVVAAANSANSSGPSGPGAPWTDLDAASFLAEAACAYQIVTSTGTFDATWTAGASGAWTGVIVSFKAVAAAVDVLNASLPRPPRRLLYPARRLLLFWKDESDTTFTTPPETGLPYLARERPKWRPRFPTSARRATLNTPDVQGVPPSTAMPAPYAARPIPGMRPHFPRAAQRTVLNTPDVQGSSSPTEMPAPFVARPGPGWRARFQRSSQRTALNTPDVQDGTVDAPSAFMARPGPKWRQTPGRIANLLLRRNAVTADAPDGTATLPTPMLRPGPGWARRVSRRLGLLTHPAQDTSAPVAPVLLTLAPPSGIVGSSVTLTGLNFGAVQGASVVNFDVGTAAIVSWSDTQIVFTVPALALGTYAVSVTTTDGTTSSLPYTIVALPVLLTITPASGTAFTIVTLTGTAFNAVQGAGVVTVGGVAATVHSWSDTAIVLRVPGLTPGAYPVVVTTSIGASNALTFTVIQQVIAGYASPFFGPPTLGSSLKINKGGWQIKGDT